MATPMKSLHDLIQDINQNEESARLLAYTFNLYHYSISPHRVALVAEDINKIFSIYDTLMRAAAMPDKRKETQNGNSRSINVGNTGDIAAVGVDAGILPETT